MAEHPCLEIKRGDQVAAVQKRLGLTTAPAALSPADGEGTFLHLDDLGFWVFFDTSGLVYSLRYDGAFPYPVEGIRIGDTRDHVRKVRGNPDRVHPVADKERWLYDRPHFFRVDFDPETRLVERMFR